MTWKELKDKISLMTEEEQQQEVAVWGELSEKDHYMRWAYIEDLLPCEEERG